MDVTNFRIELYDYERINAKTAETLIKDNADIKVVMTTRNNQVKTLLCEASNGLNPSEFLHTLPMWQTFVKTEIRISYV